MPQQRLPFSTLSPNVARGAPVVDLTNDKAAKAAPAKPAPEKPVPPKRGIKRAADSAPAIDPRHVLANDDSGDEDDYYVGQPITDTCNQVRAKIRRVIDNREMTIKDFCAAIGVGQGSYRLFMTQTGRDKGLFSDTYTSAARYFRKREELGLKLPTKKRKTAAADAGKEDAAAGAKKKAAPKKAADGSEIKTGEAGIPDVSEVELHREEEGEVPIYDTCDMVRQKINNFIRTTDASAAAFCRALSSQLHGASQKKITSAQLTAFRGKRGPCEGCASGAFYAAYVWFEKLRVLRGEPESDDRVEMKCIWAGAGGFRRDRSRYIWCEKGAAPVEDRFGRVSFTRSGAW